MLGSSRPRGLLAALVIALAGAGATATVATNALGQLNSGIPRTPTGRFDERRQWSGGGNPLSPRYPKNTGWTNASYRRAAAKKRRVAANRRAHRG